ncbi:hypothetical protein A2856_01235 [Candidatus Uhrbacteria bacterium RIFCSPHIGHO2_01_FULL_63_20]|uniref:Uncharacterized protein n=1 Tax=Candidatus Uhrbacteria bacterium RIFCSPHIGHO2_01_FULL_63_20 TaxID=1802385 RepID=A0A1F7TMU6_9BACT|nr:MAG: hypothetical protein A2856_01235 [Candidatus Uhrbacteria bacterium RIFCSPHIGHO2_01_FULL_63_20]
MNAWPEGAVIEGVIDPSTKKRIATMPMMAKVDGRDVCHGCRLAGRVRLTAGLPEGAAETIRKVIGQDRIRKDTDRVIRAVVEVAQRLLAQEERRRRCARLEATELLDWRTTVLHPEQVEAYDGGFVALARAVTVQRVALPKPRPQPLRHGSDDLRESKDASFGSMAFRAHEAIVAEEAKLTKQVAKDFKQKDRAVGVEARLGKSRFMHIEELPTRRRNAS